MVELCVPTDAARGVERQRVNRALDAMVAAVEAASPKLVQLANVDGARLQTAAALLKRALELLAAARAADQAAAARPAAELTVRTGFEVTCRGRFLVPSPQASDEFVRLVSSDQGRGAGEARPAAASTAAHLPRHSRRPVCEATTRSVGDLRSTRQAGRPDNQRQVLGAWQLCGSVSVAVKRGGPRWAGCAAPSRARGARCAAPRRTAGANDDALADPGVPWSRRRAGAGGAGCFRATDRTGDRDRRGTAAPASSIDLIRPTCGGSESAFGVDVDVRRLDCELQAAADRSRRPRLPNGRGGRSGCRTVASSSACDPARYRASSNAGQVVHRPTGKGSPTMLVGRWLAHAVRRCSWSSSSRRAVVA